MHTIPRSMSISLSKTVSAPSSWLWVWEELVKFLICPSKDLAKNAVVGSILEYIVGTLAHWADHLVKRRWNEWLYTMKSNIKACQNETKKGQNEPATEPETPFKPSPPHLFWKHLKSVQNYFLFNATFLISSLYGTLSYSWYGTKRIS